MTKYEQLSEALEQHFKNLTAPERFEILYAKRIVGAGKWRLLPPMHGRAFYPGGDGVYKDDEKRELVLPEPNWPLMLCGRDFDGEGEAGQYYKSIAQGNYHEEVRTGNTWRNLLSWLKDAGLLWGSNQSRRFCESGFPIWRRRRHQRGL